MWTIAKRTISTTACLASFLRAQRIYYHQPHCEVLSAAYRANDCQTGDWMNVMEIWCAWRCSRTATFTLKYTWRGLEVEWGAGLQYACCNPAPCRTAPKTRAPKQFGLIQKRSPCRFALRFVTGDWAKTKGMVLLWFSSPEVAGGRAWAHLSFIGGVQEKKHWQFPYDIVIR